MLKNIIKKLPGFNYLNLIRKYGEYSKDRRFFIHNYMYSYPITKEKLDYDLLFEIHKLEKGFTVVKNPRPFGKDKVKRIVRNIKLYEEKKYDSSFAYNLGYSSLDEYLKYYEEKGWTSNEEYVFVKDFMTSKKKYTYIPVGAFDYKKEDFINLSSIDYDKFLSSRRSVRNYSSKKIKENDIEKAIGMALKTPTACNRQMCKIYYVESEKGKEVIKKYAQGLTLFDFTNINYFFVTFDISANYYIGERNQGWFNSGLVTTNFINALHSLGIGSCCIQFGNTFKQEQEFKKLLNVPNNERIAVILTAGYYDDISRIPYSSRKSVADIYRKV